MCEAEEKDNQAHQIQMWVTVEYNKQGCWVEREQLVVYNLYEHHGYSRRLKANLL